MFELDPGPLPTRNQLLSTWACSDKGFEFDRWWQQMELICIHIPSTSTLTHTEYISIREEPYRVACEKRWFDSLVHWGEEPRPPQPPQSKVNGVVKTPLELLLIIVVGVLFLVRCACLMPSLFVAVLAQVGR